VPTNNRKERRVKEQLRSGAEAIALVARLQAQIATGAAEIDRLQKIEVEHKEMMSLERDRCREHNDLVVDHRRAKRELEEATRLLAEKELTIANLQDALSLANKSVTRLQAEDKDSAKLRRRLRSKEEELKQLRTNHSVLQTELAQLKREGAC
jgi:hypothetical protein